MFELSIISIKQLSFPEIRIYTLVFDHSVICFIASNILCSIKQYGYNFDDFFCQVLIISHMA